MPSFEVVASTENTHYMMWQAMLFHYSCVKYQGQVPTIVVHHNGEPLLPGFEQIARHGGRIQTAPNYRIQKGVHYPPRNTAASLKHVQTTADYIFLCDPDMIFLRSIPFEDHRLNDDQISFDEVGYLIPEKAEFGKELDAICESAGVPPLTLTTHPVSGGVPHMIPRSQQHAVSQDWLDCMELFPKYVPGLDVACPKELGSMPNQYWTTTMWALVLAAHRLRLEPVLTRHCVLNYWGDAALSSLTTTSTAMIHFCYSHKAFDKRLHHDATAANATVWNRPPDDGTLSGAINRQLREAREYYDLPS